MKKRYYRPRTPKPGRRHHKTPSLRPEADKGLKRIFEQIGVPAERPFTPDPFQIQAIEAIESADCLVAAPTGAGKTWIAEEVTRKNFSARGKTWYATPLKALTNSIHARFSELFGPENVGILTGDVKENTDASIIIGTTEILRNQLYDAMHKGEDLKCDLIILDEAHFLGDEERGVVWEEIMIYLPVRIPLLLLSATIGNPDQIAGWLTSIRAKTCHVVENRKRPVPLHPIFLHPSGTLFPLLAGPASQKSKAVPGLHKKVFKYVNSKKAPVLAPPGRLPPFGEILKVMERFDLLPAIFFLKSRAECDQAVKMCNGELLNKTPEKKQALKETLEDLVSESSHLKTHVQRQYLEETGTAAHHSGHLPAWKVVVETLMARGLLNAMFATSTVAAGVNFPARSVVILNSDRFNGVEFMPLSPSEFQQMAGRAGRRGKDNIGFAIALPGKFMDIKYLARLVHAPSLDVDSQIKINFSMVLNLLLSHTPDQIKTLLEKSFASFLISSGRKKASRTAREKFGHGLEHLWVDFLAHMDFLAQEGFVTDQGKLTDDGLWASKLRIDTPLLVAESIRENFLPDKDPALLAAIMASFVNEKEFRDDPLYHSALSKRLKEQFLDVRKGLKPFAVKMLKKGFPAPNLYIQPALLTFAWAHDRAWDELMKESDYPEGDFARLMLRTAENLRQLARLDDTFPRLADTARQAVDLILKEPIITVFD
ncbi:DEAD/DEAH box helicase [Desulfospira joergensenii]|uniref:DEAD/DEAH box helicase n=1 Tax=Desulfospira joergensenii TaxID=53329 RepID=UPI0003B4336C|nr:DEAD/DEAH box helicase [Desulfospira joergensenii]